MLDEFFRTGRYRPRSAAKTYVTSSPSMDISKASNFERFVFDLLGRDSVQVASLWQQVASGEGFDLSAELPRIRDTFGFVSGSSRHADRLATIRAVQASDGEWLDPHTADGVKVARELREAGETIVCLETALAAKFADTISEAAGHEVHPPRPAALAGLENLPQHVTVLPNSAAAVKRLIEQALA